MPQILMVGHLTRQVVVIQSAGENQSAVCTPVVYLEASVIGELNQHTTEWVQISGTPIVSLFPTSATAAYYLPGEIPGTDKVFRFYVDRNTPMESYRDVVIYTTPASDAVTYSTGTVINDVLYPSSALVWKHYVTYAGVFDDTIPHNAGFSLSGAGSTLQIPEPAFAHQTPDEIGQNYEARYVGVIVERWGGSSWVLVQTFLASEPKEVVTDLPARLRFGAIYRRPGRDNETAYDSWADYDGLAAANNVLSQFETGSLVNDYSLTRVVYRQDTLEYTDTPLQFETGTIINDYALIRVVYRLETVSGTDETVGQFESGVVNNAYTVTRVAGGNLGG